MPATLAEPYTRTGTMRAAVVTAPRTLEVRDIPIQSPGPGEVLIRLEVDPFEHAVAPDERHIRGERINQHRSGGRAIAAVDCSVEAEVERAAHVGENPFVSNKLVWSTCKLLSSP